MAEEIKKEETQENKEEIKQEPDLLKRVSQVKQEEKKEEEAEGKFNINDLDTHIEKIQDPALKEQFVGLKKSLLRGENQKYQEIANLRKQYETRLAETNSWTPDRLKQELQKPDFVQAAQVVLTDNPKNSGLSDEQWSALSEAERGELTQLKQKINVLEQSNYLALKAQQDAVLKQKYDDYDAEEVDRLTKDLMSGKVQATREHLYKVLRYETAVKKAYELGLLDKNTQNQEKVNGMTFDNSRNIQSPSKVEKQKGETTQQFFQRSYQEHSKKK